MKNIQTFLLLSCSFSYLTWAQPITSGNIINSIDPLKQQIPQLSQPTLRTLKEQPFTLSELPKVADTVTLPLKNLAPELEIKALNGQVIYKEVIVEGGWRAIERQWMVMADDDTLLALENIGAEIVAAQSFDRLGLSLLHFIAPSAFDSRSALQKVLPKSSVNTLDRNHVFSAQAGRTVSTDESSYSINIKASSACSQNLSIGMIDSNYDKKHPAFAEANIEQQSYIATDVVTPVRHGTAVASLLVGKAHGINTLLPNAKLYLASVFHRQSDFAQGATTLNIIQGLNWLAAKQLSVINMSLAGPDNQLLAVALDKLMQQNIIVVAAAGNEGPLAPPLYPAAYESVIAVSAIDQKQQVYRWANRGPHLDFSALGVNVQTAQAGKGIGFESGTSMASPVVAAAIACLTSSNKLSLENIKQNLASKAIDLGALGKDPIFGYGLITFSKIWLAEK